MSASVGAAPAERSPLAERSAQAERSAPAERSALARALRRLFGAAVGRVARLWLRTLRVTLDVHPSLDVSDERAWVLAFWHGTQWPLLAWKRRRPTLVLVSLSDDGELQTGALSVLGFSVVRGSSSRGGARGLSAIVRGLARGGSDAAFAVDGPRGPYGIAKPGVVLAARRARALVVPMGAAVRSATVLRRSWDRFVLAWPFSRVAIVLGAPLAPATDASDTVAIESAIAAANVAAESILAAPRRSMVFSR